MGGFRGGGGRGGRAPLVKNDAPLVSQNDVKQHHQFLRSPLSGFSGSAPAWLIERTIERTTEQINAHNRVQNNAAAGYQGPVKIEL